MFRPLYVLHIYIWQAGLNQLQMAEPEMKWVCLSERTASRALPSPLPFIMSTCCVLQGSDAREMVMMSLVHEHNRSMNAHHAAKRARVAAGHMPMQPQFSGGRPCDFIEPSVIACWALSFPWHSLHLSHCPTWCWLQSWARQEPPQYAQELNTLSVCSACLHSSKC